VIHNCPCLNGPFTPNSKQVLLVHQISSHTKVLHCASVRVLGAVGGGQPHILSGLLAGTHCIRSWVIPVVYYARNKMLVSFIIMFAVIYNADFLCMCHVKGEVNVNTD
jgi:hypothetical protein